MQKIRIKNETLRLSFIGFLLVVLTLSTAIFANHLNSADVLEAGLQTPFVSIPSETPLIPSPPKENLLQDEYDAVQLLQTDISTRLAESYILESDIRRRWYLSTEEGKKFGTPESWIFLEDEGLGSMWISPDAIDDLRHADDIAHCEATAGTFLFACAQSTQDHCQAIDESACQCLPTTGWKNGQGCVLRDEKGSFVAISKEEFEAGFYWGSNDEKRLNTPDDWIWSDEGEKSSWHRPESPLH